MGVTDLMDFIADTPNPPEVLVVDDDRDLADTYAVWLSERYDVTTAYSGANAQNQLENGFDVVLVDRRMPDITGDEVVTEIHRRDLDCQVAMLTAVEPDTDIIDLSFDEYLVKPVTKATLRETVDELLIRAEFDEEVRDHLSMESKTTVLENRDPENLRDVEAVEDLRTDTEAVASDRVASLEHQIARLRRLVSVIRDVDQQLVAATSREEIERTVCERLVDADPYELAWIGGYDVSFDRVSPRVMAGDDGAQLGDVESADGAVVAEAVEERSPRVVDDLADADAPRLVAPIEAVDPAERFVSAVVVPLVYRDTVYGTLNVYTEEGAVFDDREIAVLSGLGDRIANAIDSVKRMRLTQSDTVVEIEFDLTTRSDAFVALSAETDAVIRLKGLAIENDEELTTYIEVTGTDPQRFLESASDSEAVVSVRQVGNSDPARLFECRVSGPTFVRSLVDGGASVETMRIDEGTGRVTAAIAPDVDVRTVADRIRERFDDVDLVAKREVERDFQSTTEFRESLQDELTERQYTVLKVAYSAGYFDWPRGSNAKEIAESLDLAPPTLHEHLRGAQRRLVEVFFEETNELVPDDPFDDEQ